MPETEDGSAAACAKAVSGGGRNFVIIVLKNRRTLIIKTPKNCANISASEVK